MIFRRNRQLPKPMDRTTKIETITQTHHSDANGGLDTSPSVPLTYMHPTSHLLSEMGVELTSHDDKGAKNPNEFVHSMSLLELPTPHVVLHGDQSLTRHRYTSQFERPVLRPEQTLLPEPAYVPQFPMALSKVTLVLEFVLEQQQSAGVGTSPSALGTRRGAWSQRVLAQGSGWCEFANSTHLENSPGSGSTHVMARSCMPSPQITLHGPQLPSFHEGSSAASGGGVSDERMTSNEPSMATSPRATRWFSKSAAGSGSSMTRTEKSTSAACPEATTLSSSSFGNHE
jgi:hypothetical protein